MYWWHYHVRSQTHLLEQFAASARYQPRNSNFVDQLYLEQVNVKSVSIKVIKHFTNEEKKNKKDYRLKKYECRKG